MRACSRPAARRRSFYEQEALRAGWSIRELERQVSSQLYERMALSRRKTAVLRRAGELSPTVAVTPEEALRDPYLLEFLNLKDEYSESDLEQALVQHLEAFLMEPGSDFAFVARQRRLRIGGEWYRVDLLFFHRRLKCLVVIDLKVGKSSRANIGSSCRMKKSWPRKSAKRATGWPARRRRDASARDYLPCLWCLLCGP